MGDTRHFGDYTIIKQIGQGALGSVFLAEHRFLKQHFVLKVLPEELSADRPFIQRLEDEVASLAALDHPNIVRIHNVSFTQGQYFLVTDCIVDELGETTNLAQYMQANGHTLSEDLIYHLLSQVADALQYAHHKSGKAFPHRSLKLNNVLIGPRKADNLVVYLSDFGLSKIVGTGAVLTRTYLTVAESLGIGPLLANTKTSLRYPLPAIENNKLAPLQLSFLQNFAFLSPEQKRSDGTVYDNKADVYAFGILAYFLLMGEFPEGFFDMPSARRLDCSLNWDSLIRQCLHSDPYKRPDHILKALQEVRQAKSSVHSVNSATNDDSRPAQKVVNNGAETLRPVIRTTQIERPSTDVDPSTALQVDTSVKYYVPERKEVKNQQPILTDMVIVHGGNFFRGSNDGNRDEMPFHQVTLNDFAIDIHPVTNEQFVRFLDAMGGEKDSNHQDIIRLRDSRIKRSGGRLSIESGYAKHPVVGVTWYGAVAYARWIGKRLPTEAEWEIAAYGGLENALYPTGDDLEKSQANFFSSDTTPVMSYIPNGYGLFDMAGNVYEWCHDWYDYNYYETSSQEPENPKGPIQGVYRVLRGGCWKSLKEDLRCSRRHRNNPGTVNGTYGFRCVADVE